MSAPATPKSDEDWKSLKLSLERPYKDDAGNRIQDVLDIEQDGTYIYETKETADERLKSNLHRIFQERGFDFFDNPAKRVTHGEETVEEADDEEETDEAEDEGQPKPMTFDELNTMRTELIPTLSVALGEMGQAKEILESLLKSIQPKSQFDGPSEPTLSATIVNKPPPIPSLQAFNAQIVIGSKDEALRKASDLFTSVAARMERSHNRSEQYWISALKMRRSNWRMIPSPLPRGTFLGKGADKTSKDFLVLYGLEESPPAIRRRGVAHLSDVDNECQLVFANRQQMRMRISLTRREANGEEHKIVNSPPVNAEDSLDATLKQAQLELVDEEIFATLIKEASNLPTVLARVSERLIVIDASEGVEIKFELVKDIPSSEQTPNTCDLIYHVLHVLLLRKHNHNKTERLNASGNFPTNNQIGFTPLMLQPIIDFLQYKVFCERLLTELSRASQGLNAVGIPTKVTFDAVGETGDDIIQILSQSRPRPTSGEALLKIDHRHSLRLTFVAPSNLTAHLTRATLQVYSLPQLSQLLMTEIEQFVLQRICHLGEKIRGGTWFIDLDHLVARWEGLIFTFHVAFGSDMNINCSAFRVDNKTGRRGNFFQYSHLNNVPLLTWVQEIIEQNM